MTKRRVGLAAVAAILVSFVCWASPASAETVGGEGLAASGPTAMLLDGADPLPKIKAKTWIIVDADTGAVLAHKGAHVLRAPASTLKILTGLTVLPQTTPEQTYVATATAAYTYGSRVGMKPGKTYTLDQLWYAVYLPSANDAAIAVAEANGGVKKTVREMNEVAQSLGAYDTVAKTPNGLDAPGQTSSAYDLALLARAGLKRADFSKYVGTKYAEFPNVKGNKTHTIRNTNRLLLHGYHGMLGVKTGFTSNAGRTYVGAAEHDGVRLIVVAMGIRESSESAARRLLNWGFRNHDRVTPVGQLAEPVAPPSPASSPTASARAVVPVAVTTAGPGLQLPTSVTPVMILIGGAGILVIVFGLSAIRKRRLHPHRGQHQA